MTLDPKWLLSYELRDFICDLPGPGNLSWSTGSGGSATSTVSLRNKTGVATEASFDDLEQALEWLRRKAIEFYPDSHFSWIMPISLNETLFERQ